MNISSATFFRSAPDLDSCPDESLPEFAFIGRSNVGKSSLLNIISGKQGLARVSATPGFTKLINMFTMNKTWRLVDLPGYGWAHVARQDKAKFNQAVAHYLRNRPNLCLVFALIDSSLPPQKMDLEFVEWLADSSIPFVLVFTKTDKANRSTVQANIAAFSQRISEWCEKLPEIFTCSAVAKHGRKELLAVIDVAIAAYHAETEANPDQAQQTAKRSSQDPKASGRGAGAGSSHGKGTKSTRAW
ncbi:MAG: YihA family ribosome biogenesis GTP-binding protein [Verrucomicrobia bacterium]|nr:YihA family ribosome biogenesis GTP-binding protein [Verrucomicrobiota bacterium]